MGNENLNFGSYVRQLREERRKKDPAFSLRRFAQAIDVSAAFLSKMEMGEAPPPKAEKIKKMAELLEVDPDQLLSLAKKVDPVLPEMIIERPQMADFLRTANKLSDDEIKKLTQELKKRER
jgi:transcriptional regulator with XRE-family HTH domain